MSKNKSTDKSIIKELKKASELFQPQFRYILVQKITSEEKKSKGGIILSGQKEAQLSHSNKARVVALGEKAFSWKDADKRPRLGDIIHFTRYEDFIIDHSSEFLDGEYCMLYDEYVIATEIKKGE